MITLLVGHRGCGKTALLDRISKYLPGAMTVDLDAWIAEDQGIAVEEIFVTRGEEHFRQLEREALAKVMAAGGDQLFVAIGAGFTGPLPQGVNCLWVRRDNDAHGRIFNQRPRLEPGVDPLAEFRARFPVREQRYQDWSQAVFTLREGFTAPGIAEEQFFTAGLSGIGGTLTVQPGDYSDWDKWFQLRLQWGVDAFELRDDLLGQEQLKQALATLPVERVIYSFRKPGVVRPPTGVRCDWPLELGQPPADGHHILSLHQREPGQSVTAAANQLTQAGGTGVLLKYAPRIDSFAELMAGHDWAARDPQRRAFLPVSPDGRWAWYRLMRKNVLPLNFFREGGGSAPDQPLLLDWADRQPRGGKFAAILGDPVAHSHTPAVHGEWFGQRGLPVYAIRVTREEWQAGALVELQRFGLCAAAVTAPLKDLAATAASKLDPEATALGVVNTLTWDSGLGAWLGANTDRLGLATVLQQLDSEGEQVVWGGGGTLPVLRNLLPGACFYGARTGTPRSGSGAQNPDLLVWAGHVPGINPPSAWHPATVLDLSYREDSPARQYARDSGAVYISGQAMFKEQARLQQDYWGASKTLPELLAE